MGILRSCEVSENLSVYVDESVEYCCVIVKCIAIDSILFSKPANSPHIFYVFHRDASVFSWIWDIANSLVSFYFLLSD